MPQKKGETRTKVKELLDQGYPVRDVALLCGVSTQRVYQLRKKIEIEAAEAAKEDAK